MTTDIIPKSGIYCIRNTLNGKVYIGSAVKLRARLTAHKNNLTNNTHHSSKLQRAWNKYTPAAFVFEIVEEVTDTSMLIQREQHYIDTHQSAAIGYNMSPTAHSLLGFKHSPETCEKLRLINKGKTMSAETRAKLSAACIGRKGRVVSDSEKEQLSKLYKGKSRPALSILTRAKIANALRGIKRSPETRAKQALAAQRCKAQGVICPE